MSLLNRESRLRTIVDPQLLRDDELAEYEELNKARFTAKDRSLFVLVCVACPGLLIAFAVLSYRLRDDPQDLGSLFDLLGLAVLVVGPFLIMGKWNDACARAAQEREERLKAFMRRLPGYASRRPARSKLPVRRGIIEFAYLKDGERARFSEINKVERAAADKAAAAACLAGWIVLTLLAGVTTTLLPYGTAIFAVVFLLGWIPAAVLHSYGLSKAVKARDAQLHAFAASIDYASRFQPREGGGGSSGTLTHRQMQSAWYGSHSELNYTDRLRGEMYGMDVETYLSNVAEHDKD